MRVLRLLYTATLRKERSEMYIWREHLYLSVEHIYSNLFESLEIQVLKPIDTAVRISIYL